MLPRRFRWASAALCFGLSFVTGRTPLIAQSARAHVLTVRFVPDSGETILRTVSVDPTARTIVIDASTEGRETDEMGNQQIWHSGGTVEWRQATASLLQGDRVTGRLRWRFGQRLGAEEGWVEQGDETVRLGEERCVPHADAQLCLRLALAPVKDEPAPAHRPRAHRPDLVSTGARAVTTATMLERRATKLQGLATRDRSERQQDKSQPQPR